MTTFGIHVARMIPVQVIGTDAKGEDHLIGDFEGGVVLKGLDLMDVKSSQVVASFSMTRRMWIVRDTPYIYLFCQVQPVD